MYVQAAEQSYSQVSKNLIPVAAGPVFMMWPKVAMLNSKQINRTE